MEQDFLNKYEKLFHEHWWSKARNEYILKNLEAYMPNKGQAKILDIGCGDGLFFSKMEHFGSITGIDPYAPGVSKQHQDKILKIDFLKDKVEVGYYDAVMLFDVIEHVDADLAFLQRAYEVLKPGGVLFLTVPALNILWTSHDDLNHHKRRYTKSMLAKLFSQTKFEVVKHNYFFRWMVIPKIISAIIYRLRGGGPTGETIPAPTVNNFLTILSSFDIKLFEIFPLPFGGSILAVLRKPR